MTIDELLIANPDLADAVSVLIDSVKASGDTKALEKWDSLRLDSEINSFPINHNQEGDEMDDHTMPHTAGPKTVSAGSELSGGLGRLMRGF